MSSIIDSTLMKMKLIILLITIIGFSSGEKNRNYNLPRGAFTHLFEWKFVDVAKECERFLGPMGYAAVEISPIVEGFVMSTNNWLENYQTVSMRIISRFGNEKEFRDMVKRCRASNIDIYIDIDLNHMTPAVNPARGTGGSIANGITKFYPDVPYTSEDFHPTCAIVNYKNLTEVKNCQLIGLNDLDQSKEHVRNVMVNFMNSVIGMGVAGFRINDAGYMWSNDLHVIYSRLNNLKINGRYHERPFIYQAVQILGDGAINRFQYIDLAAVTEYAYGEVLGKAFRGSMPLKSLRYLRNRKDLVPSSTAVAMTDNFETQRDIPGTVATNITWREPRFHWMATAFELAYPYGKPQITSSYYFKSPTDGPPSDSRGRIISPEIDSDNLCTNGWICEHRWLQIARMVEFYNVVRDAKLENWWDNGHNQIAFSRGRLGFIVINNDKHDLYENLKTGLPSGKYCDVMTGGIIDGKCYGCIVNVDWNGYAFIDLPANSRAGVLAIHVGPTSLLKKKHWRHT